MHIAPRPPAAPPPAAAPSTSIAPPSTSPPQPEVPAPAPAPPVPGVASSRNNPQSVSAFVEVAVDAEFSLHSSLFVGLGQGISRLLQLSGTLSADSKDKLQLSHWEKLVKDYFTNKATLKFTLWKDNQRNEAKPFEIGVSVLPRFFLVTSQSGVKSMSFNLDGARERLMPHQTHGHGIVECVTAQWTYKYTNGYTVTLRGPLTAHILVIPNAQGQGSYTLKIDSLQFDATHHDKLLSLDAILGGRDGQSPTPINTGPKQDDERRYDEMKFIVERVYIPAEPVNAFGIPQATMRCLEVSHPVPPVHVPC
ncbi:LIM-domain binding protein-domain-containing protein [Sparassis latifolia]